VRPVVVLQTLVFNNKQIYLFLWSVAEQKFDFFTPWLLALIKSVLTKLLIEK
jgi:hypothetical protein